MTRQEAGGQSPTGEVGPLARTYRRRRGRRTEALDGHGVGRASEERLRTVYGAMACGVLVVDVHGRLISANDAAAELLGIGLAAMNAEVLKCVFASATDEEGVPLAAGQRPTARALRTSRPQRHIVMGITRLDGRRLWLLVDAVPVRDDAGAIMEVVTSFIDITARKQAEEELRRQALHDALTGLPNRAMLHDRLTQALLALGRTHAQSALLLLDVDHFKRVNDRLGHHAGDLLLREIGERLQGAIRATDMVARLGGDEFAVLLPATDRDGAGHAARAIVATLAEPFDLDDQRLVVGISIGIALAPLHGADVAGLLRAADAAMYVAKRAGGYAFYSVGQGRSACRAASD